MWTKLHDGFNQDTRVMELSDTAFRIYVAGLVFCGHQLTDGRIDSLRKAANLHPDLGASEVAPFIKELVEIGLWDEHEAGGWQVRNYLEYQPSREKVRSDREATRLRQQAYRDRKKDVSNGERNASRNAVTNAAPTRPDPTRPDISARPQEPVDNSVEGLNVTAALSSFAKAQNITPTRQWMVRFRDPMVDVLDMLGPDGDVEGFVAWAVGEGCRVPSGLPWFVGEWAKRRVDAPLWVPCEGGGCGGRTWVDGVDGQVPCPDCRGAKR